MRRHFTSYHISSYFLSYFVSYYIIFHIILWYAILYPILFLSFIFYLNMQTPSYLWGGEVAQARITRLHALNRGLIFQYYHYHQLCINYQHHYALNRVLIIQHYHYHQSSVSLVIAHKINACLCVWKLLGLY